ncbi:MAG: smalltalk protein [Prevotellaceae bacterium]|nr:smalltalk protein [Prevotellaceae bacterium]
MSNSKWKTIINFVITVLTAIASTFCMQSCMKCF